MLFRESDSTLWWADIQESKLFCMQWPSLKLEIYDMPQRIGSFSFVEGRDDVFLIAFETGIALYTPDTAKMHWLSNIYELGSGVRMNDGRTDSEGRFWVGSLVERPFQKGETPFAKLYRTDLVGAYTPVKEGVHISNGLCWSPDNETIYFADSPTGIIQRASFDVSIGAVGEFENFYHVSEGSPDGAITDTSGLYLSAIWGGSCVIAIDDDGKKVNEINLPASQITCLALGGAQRNIMFVTSAKAELETDKLGNCTQAEAGNLFILETDHIALPEARASISPNILAMM